MKKILFIFIILITLIFLYGRYIEPSYIKINEYSIKSNTIPTSFTELKIVHFSDLLYDLENSKLDIIKDKINNLNPDIVIFTGDLLNKNFKYKEKDYDDLKKFLKNINVSLYKFAIIGDNDEIFLDNYKDIMNNSDFILLDNENMLLFYKDINPINIIGITKPDNLDNLFNPDVECNFNLIITHKPDNIDLLKNYDINLVLAGHSLGGIIKIPYYGPLIKKDGSKYNDAYYEIDNTKLYISNGIGYDNYNFRLFNKPSINVYRFIKE